MLESSSSDMFNFPPHGHTWNSASMYEKQRWHCTLPVLCWISCNSQLLASWISCTAFSLRMLSLGESSFKKIFPYLQVFDLVLQFFACTARPCMFRRKGCRRLWDWYVIMALELVCQKKRPASCAVDKWINTLHLVQVSNEFDTVLFLVSWFL